MNKEIDILFIGRFLGHATKKRCEACHMNKAELLTVREHIAYCIGCFNYHNHVEIFGSSYE